MSDQPERRDTPRVPGKQWFYVKFPESGKVLRLSGTGFKAELDGDTISPQIHQPDDKVIVLDVLVVVRNSARIVLYSPRMYLEFLDSHLWNWMLAHPKWGESDHAARKRNGRK